jgi:hypothetical protein
VTVDCSLAKNRTAKVQVTDDTTGAEVKVLLNDLDQFGIGHALLDSSVGVNENGRRVRDTNSEGKVEPLAV